jgi:hypothetical protein
VATARGTGDMAKLRWQVGFGFEVKLAWGCMGEVHLSLCRGCRRSPKGLRSELEIKSEFS